MLLNLGTEQSLSEETLFVAALDIADPAKRLAYLDEACSGHPELRQRLEVLLRAHQLAGNYLETTPLAVSAVPSALGPLEPGAVIDRYRIIRLLGEGGMGSVYLAEQTEPLQRQVALKLIKPGLASPQTLLRFDTERQALAVMDHPNIAKVLDAGTVSSQPGDGHGQPYFVMELVTGVPITVYCDEHRLHPQARLDLFVAVCNAVQHAHQKGIIHRDLKPSNILVAEYDGKPIPKIIDFGVAKALCDLPSEQTFHSMVGMLVGTLEYMSPEQANLNSADVDTRSDVYSLGVLLYELLTGTTPLQAGQMKRAAVGEVLRIIREVDPPKPSTRLSHLRNSVAAISAQRHVEPQSLARMVEGELDWIVMKALDKDRARRYPSANNFALDVQRYLTNEPVEAVPPSRWYRLKKFVRRNRLAAAAAALVLLTLIVGILGTSYGLIKAQAAQTFAEQHFDIAQEAVVEFLDKITDDPDLNKADFSTLRKRLLKSAIPLSQRLIEQKPKDLTQRVNYANALYGLGQIQSETGEPNVAEDLLEKARDEYVALLSERSNIAKIEHIESIRFNVANTFLLLGNLRLVLNRPSFALADYEEAQRRYLNLVEENPGKPRYLQGMASTWTNIANVLRKQGQSPRVAAAYQKAHEITRRLVVENPAERPYRLGETSLLNNYAGYLQECGNIEQAKRLFVEAREKLERLAAEKRDVAGRLDLARTLCSEGILLNEIRELPAARKLLYRSCQLGEELVRDFPTLVEPRFILAQTYQSLGSCHIYALEEAEGLKAFEQASQIQERLVNEHPKVPDYAIELAGTYCNIAIITPAPEAYEWFKRAQTILETVQNPSPSIARSKTYLHKVFHYRSFLLSTENRWDEASLDAKRAIETAEPSIRNERRLMYAIILSQTNRHAEAVNEAQDVTAMKEVKPSELVMAGMVCSLAAETVTDDPDAVRRYSEAGRTLFRQAKKHLNRDEIETILNKSYVSRWDIHSANTYRTWLAEIGKSEPASPSKE